MEGGEGQVWQADAVNVPGGGPWTSPGGVTPPTTRGPPTSAAKAAGGPGRRAGKIMLEECGPLRGAALIHQAERGRTRPMCPVELSDGPGSVRPMSY